MPKAPKENWKTFQAKLIETIGDYAYRFERYGIGFSIAIAYVPEVVETDLLCVRIRRSDRHIPFDEHFHAVVFDCTDDEKGIKAASNLLTHFQHTHFSKPVFASIVSSGEYPSSLAMVSKLFFLLDYAISHNMDNLIIDKTQVVEQKR